MRKTSAGNLQTRCLATITLLLSQLCLVSSLGPRPCLVLHSWKFASICFSLPPPLFACKFGKQLAVVTRCWSLPADRELHKILFFLNFHMSQGPKFYNKICASPFFSVTQLFVSDGKRAITVRAGKRGEQPPISLQGPPPQG